MLAVEIAEPGGPDVLRPVERPAPEPGAGEIVIEVAAAGVNRPDAMQREGRYPPPAGASDIPGLEVAGTVARVGPGVRRWREGEAVCALVAGGGYAEYCAAPAPQAMPLPPELGLLEAAAVPETFATVWTNLFERGRLVPGETLLVHGGAGGIGTTAIQLASARGARVIAVAGGEEKAAACARLGADVAIDHRREDPFEAVGAATGGEGVDVVLDILGGEAVSRHLALLREEGRIVQIAMLTGREGTIDLARLLGRRLTITGSTLRPRPVAEKGAIVRGLEGEVWPLFEAGRVAPVIDSTFPLAEAAAAHRRLESREHVGKIVLVTDRGQKKRNGS